MRETFAMMSIVYFNIDYTDLLSEMSQKDGGLMQTTMGNAVVNRFIKKNSYTEFPCTISC